MRVRAIQFLAILLLALYRVPSGSHVLAPPNKLGMDEQSYFVAQQIYRGWALAGLASITAAATFLTSPARR